MQERLPSWDYYRTLQLGPGPKMSYIPKPQCEAPDTSPGVWGHKCILDKHKRSEGHVCACGHKWIDPVDPDTSKVRTVGAQLAL